MTFASNVEHKQPADKLDVARPGRRVWAHFLLRNRTDWTHSMKLVFAVNGDVRTTVPLEVEPSWSYRTFGYCTLRPTDKSGTVSAVLTDDEDALEIAKMSIPIRP